MKEELAILNYSPKTRPANPTNIRRPQDSEEVRLLQLVDAFAVKMQDKLLKKYREGMNGWDTCEPKELRRLLNEHLAKGDPVDVANFSAFLAYRGETTQDSSNAIGELN